MRTQILRSLFAAAFLAALSAGMAKAHHEAEAGGRYLAFWSGYRPASAPLPTPEACRDGLFWVKGFVSIYSQGAE